MVSSDLLSGAGFPAVEGWYTSIAAPHLTEDTKAAQFVEAFKGKFNESPDDYTITAYDAALVIIDAVKRVVASGKPVTREAVRDAIQTAKVPTIQGIGVVRRQRRPGGPHGQRVPDQEGHDEAAERRVGAVQVHRRGAAVLTVGEVRGDAVPDLGTVLQARLFASCDCSQQITQGDFDMVTTRRGRS